MEEGRFMGYIKGEERNQVILFPETIDEYIGEDNSVRVIDEYVEQLDIKKLGFMRAVCKDTGRPPYNPRDLLKLYIYGYLNHIRSSRRLEHETIRNVEVIWLLKKLHPDFKTIADFRKNNKKSLKAVYRDFNKLCDEWDLFGKELVADVEVSYNVQTAVDAKFKLIADFKVSKKPNDLGELANMAFRVKKLFGGQKFEVLADKGYYKALDLKKCVKKGITPYVSKQTYSNGTGDKDFYSDKFKYDKEKNVYICPSGKELYYYRIKKAKGKVIGYEYKNYEACKDCQLKSRCTKSIKGRTICRHIDQDFLDTIDLNTELNIDKYKLRQMIVEHPFGTVKRNWGAYYFLTKGRVSVTSEVSLLYLSYNLRRVINILGTKEIIRRLKKREKPALV